MYFLSSILFDLLILAIGVFMIVKNYKNGWLIPPVLSGIAFILLTLPNILGTISLLLLGIVSY